MLRAGPMPQGPLALPAFDNPPRPNLPAERAEKGDGEWEVRLSVRPLARAFLRRIHRPLDDPGLPGHLRTLHAAVATPTANLIYSRMTTIKLAGELSCCYRACANIKNLGNRKKPGVLHIFLVSSSMKMVGIAALFVIAQMHYLVGVFQIAIIPQTKSDSMCIKNGRVSPTNDTIAFGTSGLPRPTYSRRSSHNLFPKSYSVFFFPTLYQELHNQAPFISGFQSRGP